MRFYSVFKVFRRQYVFLVCSLILVSSSAFGVKNYWEISASEMKMLPKFCKEGFRNLGPNDWMNHLCPALNALNHAKLSVGNNTSKKYALERAIDNFSYTLGHSESPIYRPFVYLKRGEAYELAGDVSAAIADYWQALKLKPKSIAIHVALIDLYIKLGDVSQAKDLVNKGLKIKPNSKPLLRRKKKVN